MRPLLFTALATGLLCSQASRSAEPVRLVIKPLLCVVEKEGASCAVTFDIRWKSAEPGEYCLGSTLQPTPLRCWPRALSGATREERVFSEDFRYRLTPLAGGPPVSEVKVEVLQLGSSDRRRERRTRHVWDVL